MPASQTFVTQLLRIYHGRETISAERFEPLGAAQVKYLCDVGLGPIAFRTYGDILRATDPSIYSVLQSADLTIRVIYKQLESATVELLARLQSVGIAPVLLKGISTSYEFYSPTHLRLMGDVDILVRQSEVDLTMATVADLGYEIADEDWLKYYKKGHHHLPAARHPKTGITVEVHTGLFAPGVPFAQETLFQMESIQSQKVEFDYKGHRVARFTPEFQLVFIIATWSVDANWAMNLSSINDAIHILRRYEAELNCSTLSGWLRANQRLYANFAAFMYYLERTDIVAVSPQLREVLASTERKLQPRTLKILMWLLHNYPFNAREKTRDGYARWRAHAIWQELTGPNSCDSKIPFSIFRTWLRYIHHGKYNPLGWLLSLFRYFTSQLRTD